MRGAKPVPLAERFWPKVAVSAASECWEWKASVDTRGYGSIGGGPGVPLRRAHRVAYELTYGSIPDGLLVCHRCDNRKCCNPAHLFLGDHTVNNRDMIAKNRRRSYAREGNPRAKLTQELAQQIRADTRPPAEAITAFGISRTTYYAVRRGELWV